MKRPLLGTAALATAGALTALSLAPALATQTVSQADATALRLSIAGNGTDSGTVTATYDGSGETKTGHSEPPVDILGNQSLLNIGVLAQDATAQIDGQDGVSAACAGVAGQGGSVASIGDSSCITPGEAIGVSIANLNLTGVELIDPESALGPLSQLNVLGTDVLGPITADVTEALAPLDQIQIGGAIGAVEARCQARPGQAAGSANIVDGQLGITLAGTRVGVLDLPVNPPPNTELLTDLSVVITAVIEGLEIDLRNTLDGALVGAVGPVEEVKTAVIDNIVRQIEPQLRPLQDDVLSVVLNKQAPVPVTDEISVTAIDLQVLPAAAEQLGGSLVGAEIANVTCGPNSRIHPAGTALQPEQPNNPEVPTVVNSGAEGGMTATAEQDADWLAAGGLLALAGAAGMVGYRRLATT